MAKTQKNHYIAKTICITIGIAGIVVLEAIALIKAIDGAYFVPAIVAIGGLVGYLFGAKK